MCSGATGQGQSPALRNAQRFVTSPLPREGFEHTLTCRTKRGRRIAHERTGVGKERPSVHLVQTLHFARVTPVAGQAGVDIPSSLLW